MRSGTVTNNHQERDKAERKTDWGMLRWFLYVVLASAALAFFEKANAGTVRGYANQRAACTDLAEEASGGSAYSDRETYDSEIDFHVKSNLPYYTYNGKCYQANTSLQTLSSYQQTLQWGLLSTHPVMIVSRVTLLKGALARYKRSIGAYMGAFFAQGAAEIWDVDGPISYVVDWGEEYTAATWKNPCAVLGASLAAYGGSNSSIVSNCAKIVPPTNELDPSQRIPVACAGTDLSTCNQSILDAAEDYTYSGGIGEDWIEDLAEQGKTCAEIESIVADWIAALIEADAPMVEPPDHWPGNWPPQRPTPPSD